MSFAKAGGRPGEEPAVARAWRRIRVARWIFRVGMTTGMLALLWPGGPDWSHVPPIVIISILLVLLVVWAKLDLMESRIARTAKEAAQAAETHAALF